MSARSHAESRHAPLPPLLVLTDRGQASGDLIEVVRAAIDGGARAFVLREKDLPRAQRRELAVRLNDLLRPAGGLLIGADDDLDVCGGVHLSQVAAPPPADRRPAVVGRSCHDRAEIEAAAGQGIDYVTLSPVFASASKPGYGPALGIEGLADLAGAGVPVYALGGIDTPQRARGCIESGAAGVAVMGAVMRASDPRGLVEQLVTVLEQLPASGVISPTIRSKAPRWGDLQP